MLKVLDKSDNKRNIFTLLLLVTTSLVLENLTLTRTSPKIFIGLALF